MKVSRIVFAFLLSLVLVSSVSAMAAVVEQPECVAQSEC